VVATPLSSFDIADTAAAAAQPCYPRPTADGGGSNSFKALAIPRANSEVDSPSPLLSSPQRVRSPPSHGSSNIISCSSERQQIIIVFLGWEREAARTGGRAEEGTTESVNEGSGGSCVFLRRRTGSELGALARSRTATPSISIFFFLFLFIFLLLLLHRPFSFFHLSHFFEQIGWWRRNR